MTATIPSLWPDDIKVDVLPPLTILKLQAAKLREITRNILRAEVTTVTGSDDFVAHSLDLIAPALDNRRVRVLTVTHRDELYPIVVEADCFRPKAPTGLGQALAGWSAAVRAGAMLASESAWPNPNDWRPIASDEAELLKRIAEVLQSPAVRATINSLLALSNEKNQPTDTDTAA